MMIKACYYMDVFFCLCFKIVDRLLEEGRLGGLSIVVVDEAHMVGDGSRGYLLELLLTKLLAAGSSTGRLQIIALSATLPNLPDLAK